jgi:outer membrane protein assembly factor BamB
MLTRSTLTLWTFLTASVFTAAAADWPAYRGPTADGHAPADSRPPVRWSERENVRWKTAIPGKAWSSPVVLGDQVWVTNAFEDGKERFAVCLDRDTGRIVHNVKVFDVPNPAFCIDFNSYASPTPAVEPGRVYVHFGSTGTACLDAATGKVLWERRDLPCDHFRSPGSSPIIHGNLLIVAFDGVDVQYLVAFDKATGRTVWKVDRNFGYPERNDGGDSKKAYSTAAVITVDGHEELISPGAYSTAAYDPPTGRELWRITHGSFNAACRPLFAHGLVYLSLGNKTIADSKALVAVRPGGKGDVTATHMAWNYNRSVATRSSPILVGDLMYFVDDNGVALTCLDAKSGQQVKTQRLGTPFTASPVYAGGHLYFFDQNGKCYVVRPGRDFEVVATNTLAAGCKASPAVVGNALFVRTYTHLYRIEG